MIVNMEYVKSLPEPCQVETQETEREWLTVNGNVNIFCPHCGYILWNGISNKCGTCESCNGHWVKKLRSAKSIRKGDRVKFPIGDITYDVRDVRIQGGMKFACIESGYGYEWRSISSLEKVK